MNLELPPQFVMLMTDQQFLTLLSYEPFCQLVNLLPRNEVGEYYLEDLSSHPLFSGPVFYLFNFNRLTFQRRVILLGRDHDSRMDPTTTKFISYVDLHRALRLSTLGIQ